MKPHQIVPMLLLVALVAGCGMSPIQQVSLAEQTYTAASNSMADSIEQGLITDPPTLKAIRATALEADAALDVAKAAALTGNKPNFMLFVWPRASAALDHYLLTLAKAQQAKEAAHAR